MFTGTGATLFPAGEVPAVRKIPTLLRFYRLYPACVISLQHNAGTIRRIDKGKPAPIPLQVAERVDKCAFLHSQVSRNSRNIRFCEAYITLPTAAGTAPLAGVNNGGVFCHQWRISHGL